MSHVERAHKDRTHTERASLGTKRSAQQFPDQPSYESWRAMAPIMSLGEAAGAAAALSVEDQTTPRALNVKELQQRLKEQGAELGQRRW